jgi:hypothetical protein
MKRYQLLLVCIALPVIATACGSGRASDLPTATFQAQSSSAATSHPMLYVANPAAQYPGRGSVLGFTAETNGNVSPTLLIRGLRTRLGGNSESVAIDKLGRLYSTGGGEHLNIINVWQSGSSGDTKPIAHFSYCGWSAPSPMMLTFDRSGDLWVACSDEGGGSILEYPPLPADAKGNLDHSYRWIRNVGGTDDFNDFTAIAVSANGLVSVENDFYNSIVTLGRKENDGSTPLFQLGGDQTQLDGQGGISYDSQGRLIVCTNANSEPRLLTFAPRANGNVAPISTLSVAGCKGVTLDRQDNIYVVSATAITEYAAGASGSAQPLRVISGNLTGLTNASDIALER